MEALRFSCGEEGLAATKVTPWSPLSFWPSVWACRGTPVTRCLHTEVSASGWEGIRAGGHLGSAAKEASAKLLNLEAPMLRAEASKWTEEEFLTQGLGEAR